MLLLLGRRHRRWRWTFVRLSQSCRFAAPFRTVTRTVLARIHFNDEGAKICPPHLLHTLYKVIRSNLYTL